MIEKLKKSPSLRRKSAQKIMDGTNESLKEILTSKERKNFSGAANEEVKEDEYRINENDWINKTYKNPNYAEEYMESDYGMDEEANSYDPINEIENELDKELLAEAKKSLKPNTIHQGEIMDFDDYGNAIVAIYGGDIQWVIYKADKRGLKIWDHIKAIYRRQNKNKKRFVFDIMNDKKTHKNIS